MIVPDASALLEAMINEGDAGERARAAIGADDLVAPEIISLEVTSGLRRLALAGRLLPERAAAAVRELADYDIELVGHRLLLSRIWELRQNVTSYDAAYVALAEALGAPLVTMDRRLASAPGLGCRFEVIE